MKHRFCDLDCFNCKYSDCLCPDAECVNGLDLMRWVGDLDEHEIDEEEMAKKREYQRAWRAAHPDKVREYNRRKYGNGEKK